MMMSESQLAAQMVCLLCCRTSELVKVFAEEAYSVALHPTGLSVLVGFADKLRLMVVLMDDLRWEKVFDCIAAFNDLSALSHGAQAVSPPHLHPGCIWLWLVHWLECSNPPLHPVCTLPALAARLEKRGIELELNILLKLRGCLGCMDARA